MTLIVRPADIEADALAIMDGARDFARRAALGGLLPKDNATLVDAVGRVVALDGMTTLVAEHDGRVCAGIGLLDVPYLWNPTVRTCEELFWWAAKDAPRRAAWSLFGAAMEHIDDCGAVPLFRALATSPPGVGRLYRRMGFRPVETLFMKGMG